MSHSSINDAADGTDSDQHCETVCSNIFADVSKLRLEDSLQETIHPHQYQSHLKGPLRMISSAGATAKDITADFTAAASSTSIVALLLTGNH